MNCFSKLFWRIFSMFPDEKYMIAIPLPYLWLWPVSQIRLDSISTSHPISWTKRSKVSATFVIKKIKLQSYATRKPFSESARTKYQLRSRVRSNLTASVPSSFFFRKFILSWCPLTVQSNKRMKGWLAGKPNNRVVARNSAIFMVASISWFARNFFVS